MATILMKLSEGRAANQYDWWISLLTLWQDRAMKDYIVGNLLPKRGRILDIGCGTGRLLVEAGRRGARGMGIDTSPTMLSIARRESEKRNLGRRLRFETGNALNLNLSVEPFDLVVSTLMTSELQPDELHRFLDNAAKLVKPDGIVAIGDEGYPTGLVFGRIMAAVRKVSYWIVSRLVGLRSHSYHGIPAAMKSAGLRPKYKVRFMSGLLTLYVAEVT
jgi:ubiquinone/menaquinone biosynthesis C-methylase UbiE